MSSTSSSYDVIVVGARCAGAATAMLLARAGLRVLLVDRAQPGTDTLSTHAFTRAGVLQLMRWGLLDRIAAVTPAVHKTVFDYGADQATVSVRPAAGVRALYAPRRKVLDAVLVDAAIEAGVDTAFGVTVKGVQRDDTGRVSGIVGHDRKSRAFHVDAALTIGADGLRSTIAAAVDAPVTRRGSYASAFWCTYIAGNASDSNRWFWQPGATAGLIPTNDGARCAYAGVSAERFRVAPSGRRWEAFRRTFAAAAPTAADEIFAAERVEPVRGWIGGPGYSRRPYGAGWALVGDAGYYNDPIGTHGMTSALRDAELLARAVIDAHVSGAPTAAALRGYETERDRLSATLFATTDALAGFNWNMSKVQVLLRQLAGAMTPEVEMLEALPPLQLAGSMAA